MLKVLADRVTAFAKRKHTLNTDGKQAAGFRTRAQQLDGLLSSIAPLVAAMDALPAFSVTPELNARAQTAVRAAVALQSKYQANRMEILDGGALPPLSTVVGKAVTALHVALLAAWQLHAAPLIPDVNDELLNVLGQIPGLQEMVNRIRNGRRELLAASSILPTSRDDVVEFERRAVAVRDDWGRFDDTHLTAPIRAFLKGAGTTGALLSTYTEEVREWLAANGLEQAFCIRSATGGIR